MKGPERNRFKRLGFLLAATLSILLFAGAVQTTKQLAIDVDGLAATFRADAGTPIVATPRVRGYVEPASAPSEITKPKLPELMGVEQAVITYAPQVPPPLNREYAVRVQVELDVVEVVKELADGVMYEFWTFGGETPGPMLRVREGDFVEFKLTSDPDNKVPHNIDMHAVSGPGGGADATIVIPGGEASFGFRALRPGLYVYHCAMPPIGTHIGNGMYGLILVEPEEGLPAVDREYYVFQSEFYTSGVHGEKGLQAFDVDKAMREEAEYVVFNGEVGALKGDGALQASVGETIRLFVGNGGPNLSSSFHMVGEIFDVVYGEGGSLRNQNNVQTTVIPPGGAAIVELGVEVPGHYMMIDHAIFRATTKGASGMLNVVGPDDPSIFDATLGGHVSIVASTDEPR